jgi:F-type H+-transporting ATPase subunit b
MNKVLQICGVLAVLAIAPGATASMSASQPPATEAAHEPEAAEQHGEDAEHGVFSGLFWPTLNFIVLAGGLWWFLRKPFGTYLRDRHTSIRKELVEAAKVKAAAAAQLEEIDRKVRALPGEIEALKERGAREIQAEEHRIAAAAAADRERLLEQTRREIAMQLRIAKRELVEHTANLAVQLAGDRLQHQIRADDQNRLVDRYLDQVNRSEGDEGPR